MKPSALGAVLQKWEAVVRILSSELDESRRILRTHIVETALPLNASQAAEYRQKLEENAPAEVREMINSFEEQGVIRGKRELMLHLIQVKFGSISDSLKDVIKAMDSQQLDRFSERLLLAQSIEELKPA